MIKLFLLLLLLFLTSCATTCDKLKVEKEKKSCYNNLKEAQQKMWVDLNFNRR
jgi:starvation-inducible outer membrane lipoprotein